MFANKKAAKMKTAVRAYLKATSAMTEFFNTDHGTHTDFLIWSSQRHQKEVEHLFWKI